MKQLFIYIGLWFGFLSGCAQQVTPPAQPTKQSPLRYISFELERMVPGNFTYINVDALDNLYMLTNGNRLQKSAPNGDSLAAWNDVKRFGNLSYLDVTNPLKSLAYYSHFTTIVTLDKLLNLRNTLNLREKGFFGVKAVANAYDNNIWIFDEQLMKLVKIDEGGKILLETNDWRTLFPETPSPGFILDKDNIVFLYDEEKGLYLFDRYGSFKSRIPLLHWNSITVGGGKVYGFVDKILMRYDLETTDQRKYPLPDNFTAYRSIRVNNGKVYVLNKDGVSIYSLGND